MPAEKLLGPAREPERAMLQAYIQWEAFRRLYTRHRPAYASLHLNHVAYMQHRYWRAAEPGRYRAELSETDRRFFRSREARDGYEARLSGWIARSFEYTDRVLAECMELAPPGTVVLVGTALGQRPFDPVHQIHNPVVRLVNADELFRMLGLVGFQVLHQMNPDLTVNFPDAAEEEVERAAAALRGLGPEGGEALFHVQRRGSQLFLELNVPRRGEDGTLPELRHAERPEFRAPCGRYVQEHRTSDQSTAHHKDAGLLLAWRKGGPLECARERIPVTDVAPAVLSLFGIEPQPWMRPAGEPALRVPGAAPLPEGNGAALAARSVPGAATGGEP